MTYYINDNYALIKANNPDWQGALPYTVLLEPGGKRIYSQQGTIDLFELRKIIVEHELTRKYY